MPILQFLRENARWIGGGFLLCFFSSFGQTFFIALSGGEIRAEYGLTNGEWGTLYMAATLLSALTLPQLGRIVDFISVARTALIIVPCLALACLLIGWSQSVVLLFLAIYLLRLFGQGMMTHTSMTAMGRWFSARRGTAVSIATLGHQVGEALLPIAMVFLFAAIGWRYSWYVMALVLVFGALPVVFALMRVERSPQQSDGISNLQSSRDWTRGEAVRDPFFWLLLTGTLTPAFVGTTIFFHQAYLVELRAWPLEVFASAFALMAIMTLINALIAGQLIDRFGAVRLLPTFLIPLGLSCMALAFIEAQFAIFLFMGLMGISYGFSSTLFGAIWPELYGTLHLGSIRALTFAFMVLASALGPGVTGVLIDFDIAYPTQIATMGAWCLAASGIMLFVARSLIKRRDAEIAVASQAMH